jgi:UDP-2,3-diacylglucosamine pyrophosphatase LpxH
LQTVVVSDLHLSEAQDSVGGGRHARGPLWMAYKRREFFVDDDFARLVAWLDRQAEGPVEVVLNGDIFDFDNVLQLPESPEGEVDWLARLRGLDSEEWMSRHKIDCILREHPVWISAMRELLAKGNRVVFVIGNHDAELCWPSVQERIRRELGEPSEEALRFCNWFYISGDTFISHGHQYDPNCSVPDPIDPLVSVRGRARVRIPFGDLAGRYMLNGMGYFNPHASANYIMSAWQYARFFFRYMIRTQPLLLWTWFWGAITTLFIALTDHLRPSLRDPLRVEEKVREVARASNATPEMVRQLSALHVPSACTRPWALMRELWLDRGLLLIGLLFAAWQVVLHINIAAQISPLWVLVPMAIMLPPYAVYARSVQATVFAAPLIDESRAQLISQITGARRIVVGHTHKPEQSRVGATEVINGGFWSPAFAEPECLHRIGTQTFVLIDGSEQGREASLWEWPPGASEPRSYSEGSLEAAPPSRASASPAPRSEPSPFQSGAPPRLHGSGAPSGRAA